MLRSKKEQITFRLEPEVINKLKNIEKFHSKISYIIDLGIESYNKNVTKESLEYLEVENMEKEFIRVFFAKRNGSSIFWADLCKIPKTEEDINREYFSHEDLHYKRDSTKLNFYNTCEYINISDRPYKVLKREFKPDYPAMLILTLEEIKE